MDNKPSTIFQSQWVIDFNQTHPGNIDLTEDALMRTARRETGLGGNDGMAALMPLLPALRTLLHSLNTEANLTPFGQVAAQHRILTSLKNQLWANACFERHPEIRQRKLASPVIIIGPHRSGTTRILQLLATDPRLRHLRAWEGVNPAPRPGKADGGIAERYAEATQLFEARAQCYPEVHMAHPIHADWPEEEMLLMNHSFSGFSPLGFYVAPRYWKWFLQDDKHAGYRNMADLLRLVSWSANEPDDRPWVLKNPQHMLNLPTLLHTFPDAKLVFVHRDPLKTVGSILSMMWWCAVQHTDMPCRAPLRDVWLSFCENAARRCIDARRSIASSQMLDVNFIDMNRDWETVMRRVYDFIGMELTPSAQQAMAALIASDSEDRRFGQCKPYRLEDFGIMGQEVDERMMFFRKQYDIAYETPLEHAERVHRLAPCPPTQDDETVNCRF